MTNIRTLFLTFLGLNIVVVGLLVFRQISSPAFSPSTSKNSYQFNDPVIALTLLERLDTTSAVPDNALAVNYYRSIGGGFKSAFDYCSKHRAHFVLHPEMVFRNNLNFMTNYWKNHQLRTEVIPALGKDLQPKWMPIYGALTKTNISFKVDVDTNIFFTHHLFYQWRQVGKQFSCLSQAFNHVPGHDHMHRKDYVADSLFQYAQEYKSRPKCFSYDQYFPKTFVLKDKAQCEEFFKEFTGPVYEKLKTERNLVYFRKIGANAHEGSGVFPVLGDEEAYLYKHYDNGTKCGNITDNNLIQYNVHNPLLFENRKFGFRMFMLLASANPVIAYYHDGYARLSIDEYNPESKATRTFVTNIGVNLKEALKDTAFANMTASEIQEYTYWELDKVGKYLYDNKIVNDPNWVDNHLRPQFKRVMIHLVRMGQSRFHNISSVFEIFGLDFVMDADLGLWFIEANAMPLITGFTKGSDITFRNLLTNTFDIVMGLTRSRMKRVIEFVNNLTDEVNDKNIHPSNVNLDAQKVQFQKVIQNRFEPEFVPKANTTFQQIIDENLSGTKRYFGLLKAECL